MNKNGCNNDNHINEVYKQKDWDFLAGLYQLLVDEKVLNTQQSDSAIDFKFPAEVKVRSSMLINLLLAT